MSSELLHPQAEPPAFAVEWQVRPTPSEREVEPAARPAVPAVAPSRSLALDISRALGTVVVAVQGTLDDVGARALHHVLDDLIENQGNMDVIADLHGVTDVDPRCLDVFVAAHGWAAIRGGQLILTGARHQVARALEESGVDRLVKVTSDRILAVPDPGRHHQG